MLSPYLELDFKPLTRKNSLEICICSDFTAKQVSLVLRKHDKEYVKLRELVRT